MSSETSEQPWTWLQFHKAMKADGYERVSRSDPGKAYQHTLTGRKFYPLEYNEQTGIAWQQWAEARQTPPPF